MAAEEGKDKKNSIKPITTDQRFKFIGFEVFPGKPRDLFKSDSEKEKYVKGVVAKRQEGDIIRDQCTLLEDRVSFSDRLVLTIAAILVIVTLFIPWYSAYNEIVEEELAPAATEETAAVVDSTGAMLVPDSVAAATDTVASTVASTEPEPPAEGEGGPEKGVIRTSAAEEVITGYVARKKVHKEYARLSGIGSLIGLGTVGSFVFSSGFVVIITAIVFILYTLLCIAVPIYTLYGLYGQKGNPDQRALKLKKMLRLNWVPLILFFIVLVLSFFGADYGFNPETTFTSLGDSYGPAALLGLMSWGIILSLSAFILIAVKGVEI